MAKSSNIAATVVSVLLLIFLVGFLVMPYFKRSEGFQNEGAFKFIMYHSPQCGHCVRAKPEFLKLGQSKTIGGKTVSIMMVNPNTEPEKVLSQGIRGYPTFHLYGPDNKLIQPFQGSRTEASFTSFLQNAMAA